MTEQNKVMRSEQTDDDFPNALIAERYLGGDMSAETADAFEASLDDSDVLEQLAAAVALRDAATAPVVVRRATVSPVLRLAGGLATAVAAGLAVMVWLNTGGDQPTVVESTPDESFAPVWVELASDDSEQADDGIDGEQFDEFELLAVATSDAQETDVPDWLYSAVALGPLEDEMPGDTL